MDPDDSQTACFEAGIKMGSLYHQFAGTPVAPRSIDSLERAIAESIENQPFCRSVTVDISEDRVRDAVDPDHGYTELTGSLMDVELVVVHEGVEVRAEMALQDGYPLMRVTSVTE